MKSFLSRDNCNRLIIYIWNRKSSISDTKMFCQNVFILRVFKTENDQSIFMFLISKQARLYSYKNLKLSKCPDQSKHRPTSHILQKHVRTCYPNSQIQILIGLWHKKTYLIRALIWRIWISNEVCSFKKSKFLYNRKELQLNWLQKVMKGKEFSFFTIWNFLYNFL